MCKEKKNRAKRDAITKYSNDIPIILLKGTIFEKIEPRGHIFIDYEGSVTVDLTEVHR